ncbi:NAD-dependent epimerase/dehydratase family protein [Sulfitobacter aestuariivivens]|uniref:NAD-dependent epimerase/dehydratase family protein n=1 Tax=Sulfitobacter aestuariivivens TaxID=2766981 RepID=A0A927HGP8_9RHOB|nr:NAD-dependent epimerase/dehydratase family protein [Sulfitobacter aestuariivivens]MBD3664480.1 NAD-dependent epimerase/dehydratase family protein [Sulfitobacter aestuariivivens]
MHIFLTGGTGTIGNAVLAQAIAANHRVTALVRSDTAAETVTTQGATALFGDIGDPNNWMTNAAAADAFIHLASSFDDTMAETEPRLLASLAAHVAGRTTPLRVLYTGGCWLYGQTGNAVARESSPLNPISAFDWAADSIETLKSVPNLSTAVLHPAMVYHQAGGVFSRMLTALRAGRPAPIWGNDRTRWPLVHRDDAAAAYLVLAKQMDANGPFNVVAETGIEVGEIARVLAQQAQIRTRPAILPRKWVLARHGAWAEGPMLDQQMESRLLPDLGWRPQHPDFSALRYDL